MVSRMCGVVLSWIHDDHPLKKDGSAIELRLELHTLEDVSRWVLSWGHHAKVVEPLKLKQRVADKMKATLKHYK